jgi:hypothetical protein
MLTSNEPYAVIVLDEDNFRPQRRHELSLSLTFVFLLSAHLRFYFPMSNDVSRDVDLVFDQVLKDLPMESRGIVYEKNLRCDWQTCMLEGAKLVITSILQIQKNMDAGSSPNIFLDFKSPLLITFRFLENLEDDILKHQIIVYSKLINAVSLIFHEGSSLGVEQNSTHFDEGLRQEGHETISVSVLHSRF